MKILIIGFGSIGQRHLQNLLKLYPEHDYYVLSHQKVKNVLVDCQIIEQSPHEYYHVEFLHDNLPKEIDIAFICNDSSKHLEYALMLAKRGVDLFVEKPLAINAEHLDELRAILLKEKSVCFIGFQMKFHPLFLKLQELIKGEELSFVHAKWLTYLPSWHPYEDYKKSYASQKAKGGGVALTLIHELDMLNTLVPDLKFIDAISGNYSALDIDADDYLLANFSSQNRAVSLHLSFAQVEEERTITINTKDKTIMGDFVNNRVTIVSLSAKTKEYNYAFNRNKLFEDELHYFMQIIAEKKSDYMNNIEDSIAIHKLIDKMKK